MDMMWIHRLPPWFGTRLLRFGFNRMPAWRAGGGRVIEVSPGFDRMRVALPLTRRTRNVAGSIFGGSLFTITDGVHSTMIMLALGSEVIVWDKAAAIRYRRPGRETLYADFTLQPAEVESLRAALAQRGETDITFNVEIKDSAGVLHTLVERTVYVADKSFYKRKISEESA